MSGTATRRPFDSAREPLAIRCDWRRPAALAIGLIVAACVAAVPARNQTAGNRGKPAEQAYKNIQVLTGLPASELDGVMYFMSAALGVGCAHCHTSAWDSDEKSTKLATRKMIVMTRDINRESFSGNPAITCYTCHRGRHNTEPLPPPDLPSSTGVDNSTTVRGAPLPPADEVVARYTRAIGGRTAIDNLTSLVTRGAETATDGMSPPHTATIEIVRAAPNRLLIARNEAGRVGLTGFDGSKGWTRDSRGVREMAGKELDEIRREAELFRYLKIGETYPQMRVLSKEKVRDREAYVIGATSREESREKLYFDVETGLLIRRLVAFRTAFGAIPEVIDFDDYRQAGALKLPFSIIWSRSPLSSALTFVEVRVNGLTNNFRFEPPVNSR